MIKLIATDLDGTLLDSKKRLPEDFELTLNQLTDRGIRFFAASGRSHYILHRDFSRFPQVGLICENGAFVSMEGEILVECPIDGGKLRDAAQLFGSYPGIFFLMCGKESTYSFPIAEKDRSKYVAPYYANLRILNHMDELKENIYKIAVCDEKGPENGSHEILNSKLPDGLKLIVSGDVWMDAIVDEVSKGNALELVQKKLNILPEETMAFGDYNNDLEMFEKAYYSYAMANARPYVKSRARFTALSNDEDGVMTAIKELILNR